MKIEGSYEFNAPRQLVWEMLLDPNVLGRSMPGCQALEQVGVDKYKGVVTIQVGPVQGVFQGAVRLSDLQELESYRIQVNGRGPAGMIDGLCAVRLEENGSSTIMHYTGDANISGRIASVGQRVMDSSARAITKQSLINLDGQIQARLAPVSAPPAEIAAPEPRCSECCASCRRNPADVCTSYWRPPRGSGCQPQRRCHARCRRAVQRICAQGGAALGTGGRRIARPRHFLSLVDQPDRTPRRCAAAEKRISRPV